VITWTHIHFVTIGAFTQLLFGTLPQLAARKLERPGPSPSTFGVASVGLNVALVLVWYGRAFGEPLWFDIGLGTIWLLTSWLFAVVLVMVRRSDGGRARDPTIGFYLLSPFVYLIGLALAFGLYSHGWDVPGGWYGLREAHVHANAWGFLGLAAIGTLYDLFPRLVDGAVQRAPETLLAPAVCARYRPARRRTGTRHGEDGDRDRTGAVRRRLRSLHLHARSNLLGRNAERDGALSALVAQLWILGPASFAPFILFGVPLGIPDPWIETGALHFFFLGWALPIALAGLLLVVARSLEWSPEPLEVTAATAASTDSSPEASPVGRRTEVRPRLEPRGPRRRDRLLLSGPVVVGATARLGIRRPPRTLGLLSVQNHRATVGGAGTCVAGLSAIPNSVGTSAVCTTIVWMGVHRCEQLVDHVSPTARRVIVGRRRSSVAVGERDSGASRYRTISG